MVVDYITSVANEYARLLDSNQRPICYQTIELMLTPVRRPNPIARTITISTC
jgi:hypothetical protein